MPSTLATLASEPLPYNIKYNLPVPNKRYKITKTYAGVLLQSSCEPQVAGDATIDWKITGASVADSQVIKSIYDDRDLDICVFEGHWGDRYLVMFAEFSMENPPPSQEKTGGCYWNLRGKFRVLCTLATPDPELLCPPCDPNE